MASRSSASRSQNRVERARRSETVLIRDLTYHFRRCYGAANVPRPGVHGRAGAARRPALSARQLARETVHRSAAAPSAEPGRFRAAGVGFELARSDVAVRLSLDGYSGLRLQPESAGAQAAVDLPARARAR